MTDEKPKETNLSKIDEFALHLGFVGGAIHTEEIRAYFKERGLDDFAFENLNRALSVFAVKFYENDRDTK